MIGHNVVVASTWLLTKGYYPLGARQPGHVLVAGAY